MKCPNCHKPKTKEDFYWKKGTEYKAMTDCKECISKTNKEKYYREGEQGLFNLKLFAYEYRR